MRKVRFSVPHHPLPAVEPETRICKPTCRRNSKSHMQINIMPHYSCALSRTSARVPLAQARCVHRPRVKEIPRVHALPSQSVRDPGTAVAVEKNIPALPWTLRCSAGCGHPWQPKSDAPYVQLLCDGSPLSSHLHPCRAKAATPSYLRTSASTARQ